MQIKKLAKEQFDQFVATYDDYSIYQTTEYAEVMYNQKFSILYIGLIDNEYNIFAASLLLIEKKFGFKYAYAPKGFLIDYKNYSLLQEFTYKLKKFLSNSDIIAIKINPLIIKNIYDCNNQLIETNPNYDLIYKNLKNCGYYHLGYNNYFESLKPRFEAIIDLKAPYLSLFKNIKKEYRTKIRSAEFKGIKIYKGNKNNLEDLYSQTEKKYPRDKKYFDDCYDIFSKKNMIEFYYAKLDTSRYLKIIQNQYEKQEEICSKINNIFMNNISKNNNKIINKKIASDKNLEIYKKKLIIATKLLKEQPNGILISTALITKYRDNIYILIDGYNYKYKNFNGKHLLIWKLIEKYSRLKYKNFNLGGISNVNLKENKYKGLNQFKLNFGAKTYEYIGDLELITNNTLYFMYRNSAPIRNILKK